MSFRKFQLLNVCFILVLLAAALTVGYKTNYFSWAGVSSDTGLKAFCLVIGVPTLAISLVHTLWFIALLRYIKKHHTPQFVL